MKTKRAKPRTPKPRPNAFVVDTPCEHCGCEWGATTVDLDSGDFGTSCANPYCVVIQQLRMMLLAVAKLSADSPQFDSPLHAADAVRIRDKVLAGTIRISSRPKSENAHAD